MQGAAKPCFVFYFGANDKKSPVYKVAEAIRDLMPDYELFKISESRQIIRGACVLIYSPTKTAMLSGGGGLPPGLAPPNGTQLTSGNQERLFSLKQLLNFTKVALEKLNTRLTAIQCIACLGI